MGVGTDAKDTAQAAPRIGYGRDFGLYAVGQAVSIVGDRVASIALVFLVVQLSGSFAPALALFYVARVLPTFVAGLIVGVFADQLDRRRLMIGCDIGRAILLCAVPLLIRTGIWTIYPVVVALYALNLVFNTSARAALPDVIPETRLLDANSILFGMETAGDAAYALGGFLVFAFGLDAPFYIDAGTFAFSAAMITSMHISSRHRHVVPDLGGFMGRIRAGIAFLFAHPFLRSATFAQTLASVAVGSGFVLAPLYANNVLDRSSGLIGPLTNGAFRFGVLEVGLGLGAFAGSGLAARLANRWPRGRMFGVGLTASGAADALLALTSNVYVATALLAASGLFTSFFMISSMTLLQALTPSDIRGRAVAARTTVIQTAMALGSALTGLVLLALSVQALWALEGGLLVAASLYVWLRPTVRSQP